jgi:hypothetical protein
VGRPGGSLIELRARHPGLPPRERMTAPLPRRHPDDGRLSPWASTAERWLTTDGPLRLGPMGHSDAGKRLMRCRGAPSRVDGREPSGEPPTGRPASWRPPTGMDIRIDRAHAAPVSVPAGSQPRTPAPMVRRGPGPGSRTHDAPDVRRPSPYRARRHRRRPRAHRRTLSASSADGSLPSRGPQA